MAIRSKGDGFDRILGNLVFFMAVLSLLRRVRDDEVMVDDIIAVKPSGLVGSGKKKSRLSN
jgi:hypothetical protein